MEHKRNIWNPGLLSGLVLGAISIIYFVVTQKCSIGIVNLILWMLKLGGCILFLRFAMLRFAKIEDGIVNSDTFKMGLVAAVSSAILFSAFYLAYMLYIDPDAISNAINTALEQYEDVISEDVLEQFEAIAPRVPQIGFWANLVYCSIFGTVLSAILSRNIPSRNPFNTPDEQ